MKGLFFLLLILTIQSCSLNEDDTYRSFPVWLDSLAVEKVELRTVDFSVHIYCGSMCWNGYYFQMNENGNNINLKLFVTADGNPCPDVCVERSFPFKYTALHSGTFAFSFWQNDSTSLDTTIVFN